MSYPLTKTCSLEGMALLVCTSIAVICGTSNMSGCRSAGRESDSTGAGYLDSVGGPVSAGTQRNHCALSAREVAAAVGEGRITAVDAYTTLGPGVDPACWSWVASEAVLRSNTAIAQLSILIGARLTLGRVLADTVKLDPLVLDAMALGCTNDTFTGDGLSPADAPRTYADLVEVFIYEYVEPDVQPIAVGDYEPFAGTIDATATKRFCDQMAVWADTIRGRLSWSTVDRRFVRSASEE